jgi:TPP-dependent indolepyruvate ferredoxin oxidoreductase alpha subunit
MTPQDVQATADYMKVCYDVSDKMGLSNIAFVTSMISMLTATIVTAPPEVMELVEAFIKAPLSVAMASIEAEQQEATQH